jgi:hypothetical protein
MKEESDQNAFVNHGTILKELSDIKSSLAVNTSETANIKVSIIEIKNDIREIKNDFVNRREHTEALANLGASLREEISPLRKILYGVVALVGTALIGALMKLVIRL